MRLMRFEDGVYLKHKLLPYVKRGHHPISFCEYSDRCYYYGFHPIILITDQFKISDEEVQEIISDFYGY